MIDMLNKIIFSTISIMNDTAMWLVLSFLVAGALRNILTPEKFQRALGNTKMSSIIKATVSGMFLPICSCGVIPLGVSMYYSGAYLGPTLAFMTATPIINPVAVLLTVGLLGPKIGIIYIVTGIIAPIIIGVIANKYGGGELKLSGIEEGAGYINLEQDEEKNWLDKLGSGFHWAFLDLGFAVSKYVVPGVLLAGIILSIVPEQFIQSFLGEPGLISLGGIAVLSGVMYVCAVGHIPFIAALIAGGASPGTAITFLMTGAATNIPELISIYKLIGKRAVILYGSIVTVISLIAGYITNLLLLPGFKPFVNLDRSKSYVKLANSLIIAAPEGVKYFCSLIICILFALAVWPKVREFLIEK